MIAQIFTPTAEVGIPTGTQTIEPKTEIETQAVIAEDKISKFST